MQFPFAIKRSKICVTRGPSSLIINITSINFWMESSFNYNLDGIWFQPLLKTDGTILFILSSFHQNMIQRLHQNIDGTFRWLGGRNPKFPQYSKIFPPKNWNLGFCFGFCKEGNWVPHCKLLAQLTPSDSKTEKDSS